MSGRIAAACVFALVAGIAAGCGGSGSSASGTTTTVVATTATTATTTTAVTSTVGVKPSAVQACRQLNAAAQSVTGRIGATLAGFKGITSVGSLKSHVTRLRADLNSSAARFQAVSTPPGKLTRDKTQFAAALHALSVQVEKAQKAAASGHVGAAASGFSSAAQLTKLRKAAQALGRDCPRVP